MNWKDIEVARDWTHFLYKGKILFGKRFKSVLKFKGNGLAPVEDEEGWYFINPEGNVVVPGPFQEAWGFYCGLSAIKDGSDCYHIDEFGRPAYAARYTWCGNFQEDKCSVKDFEGNYFHVKKNGERLYAENYHYVGDFKDGLACVMLMNGYFKHIDETGAFIYAQEYLDLGVYHKGFAAARDARGWLHIDMKGQALYAERYAMIEPYYNGVAFGESLEGSKVQVKHRQQAPHSPK